MNSLIEAIADGWSWKLGQPVAIIDTNLFGNAIVKNTQGQYFRIIPEEWSCELLADSPTELEEKTCNTDFEQDWAMERIVALAKAALGPLDEGQVYYLVTPGILGGQYEADNIRKIRLQELFSYSGDMAHQIEGVPDGGKVKITLKK